MYLMIDNYDSFVYNLVRYLEELGEQVQILRNDKIRKEEVEKWYQTGELEGIILSPGPKSPEDCGICKEILRIAGGRIPVLGVCLGHQIIGHVYGAEIRKGDWPMHGKVTKIITDQTGLFYNLPKVYWVTRYHSLVVSEENLPEVLVVNARSEDGAVMGIQHREFPIFGVQFHPEAVLTEYGYEVLYNFTEICRKWWKKDENNSSATIFLQKYSRNI